MSNRLSVIALFLTAIAAATAKKAAPPNFLLILLVRAGLSRLPFPT